MQYNGSVWIDAGMAGFSDSSANYTSIALNSGGIPYVAYMDFAHSYKATVMSLDTALHPITGLTDTVCAGTVIQLDETTAAGTWSSSNSAIATVSSAGIVAGIAAGTDTISYTVPAGSVTYTVIVTECTNSVGNAPVIPAPAIQVYPNPNDGTFTVSVSSTRNEAVPVIITNALGQKVKELMVAANKEVEVHMMLPPGVYFLSANDMNAKIVVQ